MFADDAALLYADGVEVTPPTGAPFMAFLNTPDAAAFEVAQVSDWSLQYSAGSALLRRGDVVIIGSSNYRVAGNPTRINDGADISAPLIPEAP